MPDQQGPQPLAPDLPVSGQTLLYTADASLLQGSRYMQLCDVRQVSHPPQVQSGLALWWDDQGLLLINAELAQPLRLTSALLVRRWRGKSLLRQACGVAGGGFSVMDPFAGFGLDALTLVHYGCAVSTCEQHLLVWLMQVEFAERMGMQLDSQWVDGRAQMRQAQTRWDVVYLDPMFPARRKRALPNLALQHLQQLCRRDQPQSGQSDAQLDVEACLTLAQSCAQRRVVLKRRPKDPVVGRPSHQIKGQAVRFDVYL